MQDIPSPLFYVDESWSKDGWGSGDRVAVPECPFSATREPMRFTQGYPVAYMININSRHRALEKLVRLALPHQKPKCSIAFQIKTPQTGPNGNWNCGQLGAKHKGRSDSLPIYFVTSGPFPLAYFKSCPLIRIDELHKPVAV